MKLKITIDSDDGVEIQPTDAGVLIREISQPALDNRLSAKQLMLDTMFQRLMAQAAEREKDPARIRLRASLQIFGEQERAKINMANIDRKAKAHGFLDTPLSQRPEPRHTRTEAELAHLLKPLRKYLEHLQASEVFDVKPRQLVRDAKRLLGKRITDGEAVALLRAVERKRPDLISCIGDERWEISRCRS